MSGAFNYFRGGAKKAAESSDIKKLGGGSGGGGGGFGLGGKSILRGVYDNPDEDEIESADESHRIPIAAEQPRPLSNLPASRRALEPVSAAAPADVDPLQEPQPERFNHKGVLWYTDSDYMGQLPSGGEFGLSDTSGKTLIMSSPASDSGGEVRVKLWERQCTALSVMYLKKERAFGHDMLLAVVEIPKKYLFSCGIEKSTSTSGCLGLVIKLDLANCHAPFVALKKAAEDNHIPFKCDVDPLPSLRAFSDSRSWDEKDNVAAAAARGTPPARTRSPPTRPKSRARAFLLRA